MTAALFGAPILLGAFLLFAVQPLAGKWILPWFGGTPAVWTTCLLFFQTMLVGGYAWAHLLAARLAPGRQALAHGGLLLAALLALPIVPAEHWKPGPESEPTVRILLLLAATLGLPYVALAATAPLLQAWLALARPGRSPYRYYALSNAGSLGALLAYPFVIEPWLARRTQALVWSWGFAALVVLVLAVAWRVRRVGAAAAREAGALGTTGGDAPGAVRIALWLAWPACGTALLMAASNKMVQDVAAIPFLWVLPLALYLLTFVIAFESPRRYGRPAWGALYLAAAALAAWALGEGPSLPIVRQVAIHSLALFAGCMVCHGEVYRLRPEGRGLTAFYLAVAAGGALGGAAVAVGAPLVFSSFVELELALGAVGLLLVVASFRDGVRWRLPVFLGGPRVGRLALPGWAPLVLLVPALWIALGLELHEVRRWATVRARNFYGVLQVIDYHPEDPAEHYRTLLHGRITHGLQYTAPEHALRRASYFGPRSGIGRALAELPAPRHVGVLGLGVGTLAAWGGRGDTVRFYEIDPNVRQLAAREFTYLSRSPARVEVVMGDGRLSLEREAPRGYDLLALDAFTSDAVPVHLLTREAMAAYLRHVKPGGIVAFNVTNRYLELEPVVRALGEQFGLASVFIEDGDELEAWEYGSSWVLLSRDRALLERARLAEAATSPDGRPASVLWTDDWASLWRALRR